MTKRSKQSRVIDEREVWSAHANLCSLRTSEAMRAMRMRGEYTGGRAPFGYQLAGDGVTLEPNPAEQTVIADARALRAAGMSLRDVTGTLAERGICSRAGLPLGLTQVARLLKKPGKGDPF